MNKEILEKFIVMVDGGRLLEIGLRHTTIDYLRSKFDVESFDIDHSRFKFDSGSDFKQNMFIKLPYEDGHFNGAIIVNLFNKIGDGGYFLKELFRVIDGPILLMEDAITVFPLDFFEEADYLNIYYVSNNGTMLHIGQSADEFANRPDLKRIFYRPGGSLNKFSLLVPEDIKTEVGILCQKK